MGSSRHGGRSFASYAPKDAGWSLDDYAYDPKAREVVSRGRNVTDSGANFDAGGGAASLPAAAAGGGKQREASKRARRPPLHTTEDFEHDAPKPAPSNGHAASKATEGLMLARVRRGKSLDSTDAPSSHRSGGGSLASAPSDPGFIHPLAGIRQCPVDDCTNCCYPSSKRRVERVLCGEHAVAPSCDVGGIPRRFCQVCYVLHGLAAFKGKNKTCTAVLQRKKVMRAQAMEGRMRATNQSGGSGGGSGDGSVHGVSNGGVSSMNAQVTQRADTKKKRKAAQKTGGGSSENVDGVSSGGSGSVVLPSNIPRESTGKRKLANGKSTISDDSDPSDDPGAPAFDPWGVNSQPVDHGPSNTAPVNQAAAGHEQGGFFQNLWHSTAQAVGGGWHAQREREVLLERALLRDMEHGAISSLTVPSAAIKVPDMTPEVFLRRQHKHSAQQQAPTNVAPALPSTVDTCASPILNPAASTMPVPGLVPTAGLVPAAGLVPTPGLTNVADNDWLQFFCDARTAPGVVNEDDGYDVFIRPGSLIFGVHSQSAVPGVSSGPAEMLRSAAAADDGIVTRATTRIQTRSRSRAGDTNTDTNTDTGTHTGSEPSRGFDGSYDASGPDGLLRIPEGVFGSFNGEICKLEHDGVTGETLTVPVRGAPEGLHANALASEESVLDSSKSVARVRLPFALDGSVALVCMFRGAHLPCVITRRGKRETELTISFKPKGGFRAAETWRSSGGKDDTDGSDGSDGSEVANGFDDYFGDVEGTATLEAVIAEGHMRGLPVGAAIPLLLTPDKELRLEVVDAMNRLEWSRNARAGANSPSRFSDVSSDVTTDSEDNGDEDDQPQMPPPVALISMLGAVLAARNRGLDAAPRLARGAAAMTRYFRLEHTARRIGCDYDAWYGRSGMDGYGHMGAYHGTGAGVLPTLFNAVTAVLAALWHVRLVGFTAVMLAATVKAAIKATGGGIVGGVPALTWDVAMNPGFIASVLSVAIPAVTYREALRFASSPSDPGTSKKRGGSSSKTWSNAHAKHAVRAQNRGAMIWPFVAIAFAAMRLVKLRGDASLNSAKLLLVAATEIVPAATLLVTLQFPEWNTRAKRRANWPAVSVTVHIARMAACLLRGHMNHATRTAMYVGQMTDAVSSTLAVAMFPMWGAAETIQVQTGVVACDWIGHYLRTGTTPAYLSPAGGQLPLTVAEVWCRLVYECVWRVLTPAAANAYAMHRIVKSHRRRVVLVEDAHSE